MYKLYSAPYGADLASFSSPGRDGPIRTQKAGYGLNWAGPAGSANPAPPIAIRGASSPGPIPLTLESVRR